MDLLLKIIACEDICEEAKILDVCFPFFFSLFRKSVLINLFKQWLCQTDLMISLVNKFDPSLDEETIENASQALVDIIAVSARTPNSPLMNQLESEPLISKLFDFILSKVSA